ncbi:MAG: FGGY-family carbohydrate kinase [Pseudomonadota bacterium]
MTAAPLFLAIDQGTQSARALLFDPDGNLVARSKIAIEPYFSAHPGWAEQHPQVFWEAVCRACRELWQQNPEIDRGRVSGVALTTQRATVVNIDAQGEVLRPAIVWLDQRRAEGLQPMPRYIELLFGALGERDTLNYFRAQAECNWLAQNQRDIWRRTDKFLLLSGYLGWKLCGEYVDSTASQVGYLPFDFKRHEWARPFDWKWQALDVRRRQLPELVPPGRPLGSITREASEATGIPAGLPLLSAGADKACEVLGSGALAPDTGALSFGTTATFNTCNDRYVEAIRFVPPYPAAVPGRWNTEQMVQRGYWMVQWFKQEFAQKEMLAAEELGVEAEALFEKFLDEVPPGAMGLVLQPYWSPGVRVPGPEAKGAMIGFGDVHTRAHIYRAIIEGIGYALREAKERVEKRNGVPVRRLRVAGGGSQSDAAMQITADIFNLPAERPHVYEASGLGAAINVAVGTGLYPDYETAVRRMTRVGRRFEPLPQNARLYDRMYRRVYRPLYDRLAPLYRDIRRITGYPA